MNQLNRTLAPEVETVYVMASPQVSFVSSSGVKEIAAFGGDVSELVPQPVARRLAEIFPDGRPGTPERPGSEARALLRLRLRPGLSLRRGGGRLGRLPRGAGRRRLGPV